MIIGYLQYISDNSYSRNKEWLQSINHIKSPHKVIIFRSGRQEGEDINYKLNENIFIFKNINKLKGINTHCTLQSHLFNLVGIPYYYYTEDDFSFTEDVKEDLDKIEKIYKDNDGKIFVMSNNRRRLMFTLYKHRKIYDAFEPSDDKERKIYNGDIIYKKELGGLGTNDGFIVNGDGFVQYFSQPENKLIEYVIHKFPNVSWQMQSMDQGYTMYQISKYGKMEFIKVKGLYHNRGGVSSTSKNYNPSKENELMLSSMNDILDTFTKDNSKEIDRLKEWLR